MANFWADKLAREAGQQPLQAAPATQQPWWRQNVYDRSIPATQPAPAAPVHPNHAGHDYATTKARHQIGGTGNCPACYGENFFKATPNTITQCFDCGYPVQHSTSGMTAPNTAGEATKAALGQSTGQGYRPDIIVGRI